MLYTGATVEHRERVFTPAISVADNDVHVLPAEDRRQKLEAERAMDTALADSFPASDPPSWTSGIARPQPRRSEGDAVVGTVRHQRSHRGAWHVTEEVIDASERVGDRTFAQNVVSLAGAVGIALLVPFVILLVGLPIVLAIRGIAEAVSWLRALIFG